MVSRCKGRRRKLTKTLAVPKQNDREDFYPLRKDFRYRSRASWAGATDGALVRRPLWRGIPPIVQMCPSLPGSDAHVTRTLRINPDVSKSPEADLPAKQKG